MKNNGWLYLFIADLLLDLIAIMGSLPALSLVAKPLLVPLLLVWYLAATGGRAPLRFPLLLALGFSWLGDVFLLMDGRDPLYFMAGLGSFLAAHACYIFYFLGIRRRSGIRGPWNPLLAAVISVMLLTALHAFGREQRRAGAWAKAGALLFVLSDSCLALNKFYVPFSGASLVIMASYALAQLALVKGAIDYSRSLSNASEAPGSEAG
jgi:uncharacterized membrane protein YhhN